MNERKECKLGEVAERITSGGTPSTKNPEYYNGNIPWLNTKEINFNRIFDTETKITEMGLKYSSAKWIKENSIIVAMYGATAGKIAINKIPLTTNQACCNITIDSMKADYRFIYYSLLDSYQELENLASGAAQQNLNVGIIGDFLISLPPFPEQRAIAGVLSSLDDKIDLLHRQNKVLESMAEAIYKHFFLDGRIDAWKDCIINNLATHEKTSIRPDKKPDILFEHYSVPAYDESYMPVRELGALIKSNKYIVKPNTILFSKLNPDKDKRVWLIPSTIAESSICSTEFQVINPKDKKHLFFLYGFITYPANYNEIAAGVGGTSGSHQRVDPEVIFKFKCFIPNDETLTNFNKMVEPIFNKMYRNLKSIQTLSRLRDTILPKLMSGDVRVRM
jgi:type I restriction enzyme S subunit